MLKPKEVLVIEDDQSLTFIYQQILRSHGIPSHIVHNGEQAMEYLESHYPDIVILDMHVPYVSGVEILHHIRKHPHSKDAYIILASADSVLCRTWQDKVDQIFIKPFNLSELAQTVKAAQPEKHIG